MTLRQKLSLNDDPVFLIDGSSFLYRGFYAFPDLKRSDGFPTNAIFIVLRILFKLIREEKPKYAAFFMDGKGPNFRNEIFEDYKAQRLKMPEDLAAQIDPLLEGVRHMGFKTFVSNSVEADDLIASQASALKKDVPVVIVASDKDLRQLLDDRVVMWDPGGKGETVMTVDDFRKSTGFEPWQWPDYQALVGDSSDNIPGVPGVGPKTAASIMEKFPTLEAIRDHFDELAPKIQKKIQNHLEDIFIYRRLTRLKQDCGRQGITARDLALEPVNYEAFADFLKRYEFRSLLRELPQATRKKEIQHSLLSAAGPLPRKTGIPDFKDNEEAGLYPVENGFLLGMGRSEWKVALKPEELQKKIAGSRLYVISLKDLAAWQKTWLNPPHPRFFDISLAAYLLNTEARQYDYEHIFRAYSSETGVSKDNPGLACLQMGKLLQKKIESAGLKSLMRDIEMPLIPVLLKMEAAGIGIDLNAFSDFLEKVEQRLKELTTEIFSLAGKEFNIRSTQQTAVILFEDLGLKSKRKTPGGAFSTSNVVLEAMKGAHPIIRLILEFRTLEKLRSTYLAPLPDKIAPDGRLHTTFNQLATATGRLSSSSPNLQNIPIRGEFGPRMRACFTSAPGKLLVAADYSQIELRILAHMSQDPNLLDSFSRSEDIHTRTAGLLFEKDISEISTDERRKAKTINFGLLYGMGPQKLSRELSISQDEAKKFIKIYFSKLDRVRKFYEDIEKYASEKGCVTTIAGRRRLLPGINSRNANLVQQARRMAINTVIQGSAADVIKKAMLAVDRDEELRKLGADLILQVHDELLIEVDKTKAEEAGERLARVMSEVEKFDVPLLVDWGIGENWAQAHE
ncbi:MAG: DNA polymerase I [Desulfonatronovibrio sp.]